MQVVEIMEKVCEKNMEKYGLLLGTLAHDTILGR